MRIRLTEIPLDELARVRPLADALRDAVNAGDMEAMDEATEKLVTVTAAKRSANVSEQEWRRFLTGIRVKNPAFQADYLLPGEVCSPFFPNVTPETMVLQFPVDEKEGADV